MKFHFSQVVRGLSLFAFVLMPACRKSSHERPAPLESSPGRKAAAPPPGDRISQGLWWLYQLQYEQARNIFSELARDHPEDPTGPFYETATDWWQLAQDFDLALPEVETRFQKDSEETVKRAQATLHASSSAHQKGEADLCWGGAEGLRGRWWVTRKEWMKAYSAGKDGREHLLKALKEDPHLTDAYLGLGIYDYYTDVLPGLMGALSKMMMHGNRPRGLEELRKAIQEGAHSQVEAKVFLLEIYGNEEHQPARALPLAQALHHQFPDSPAMHMAEILCDYKLRRWNDMAAEAQIFLDKAEKKTPFYTDAQISPGRYFVGVAALLGRHEAARCLSLMNSIIQEEPHRESRWISFAYLRRGQAYDRQGQRHKAEADYHRVLERPDIWGSHHETTLYLQKAKR